MAIRYDTPEDFERDKLKEQALQQRLVAEKQSGLGMTFIGGSFIADYYQARKPQTRGWLSYLSAGLGILGIIDTVRSWFTSNKAHNLELERERMGPQMVVLPDGMNMGQDASCGCSHASKHAPKSHADYALKSADSLIIKS